MDVYLLSFPIYFAKIRSIKKLQMLFVYKFISLDDQQLTSMLMSLSFLTRNYQECHKFQFYSQVAILSIWFNIAVSTSQLQLYSDYQSFLSFNSLNIKYYMDYLLLRCWEFFWNIFHYLILIFQENILRVARLPKRWSLHRIVQYWTV